ncbi:release factor glutamine methyltransferase [Salipiger pallidus]|uniref:Release factor glutamine methyltransferase n=1 Tax=Salipiger pallidus TaxID=1775170 RepID=A0A8J2ZKT7_9RHOB|nr:peptide chain release factor N(5)-glutamine methyltransferase [Salipiger pallidus]GGG75381.1 release factor glutamine methyltransferase [Salipiger pallidus]
MSPPTGSALLVEATRQLSAAGIADAGRDARRLLAHVLRVPPGRLTLFLPEPVADEQAEDFSALVTRRAGRVPMSHLTGRRAFYGRDFRVNGDVLDPRPETEMLIEAALGAPFEDVLDLGTGSGCILLTLLAERPTSRGIGTDLSAAALEVAAWNRDACKLEDRASFRQGSWWEALPGDAPLFDLIVSNPPYIALSEMPGLSPEVRDHEPRMALTDEGDGLAAYRAISSQLAAHLAPAGRALVEIGPTQGAEVAAMFAAQGLQDVAIIPDLDGRDRVVAGRKAAG